MHMDNILDVGGAYLVIGGANERGGALLIRAEQVFKWVESYVMGGYSVMLFFIQIQFVNEWRSIFVFSFQFTQDN